MRANGSYLGATPTGPTTAVASGIWGLRDAERYNRDGEWPAAPGAPTGLAVDSTGDGTIDLSWTAPATGNVTDYSVEYTDVQPLTGVALLAPFDSDLDDVLGITATATNTPTVTSGGQFGSYADLGAADKLTYSSVSFGSGDYTVECWIKRTESSWAPNGGNPLLALPGVAMIGRAGTDTLQLYEDDFGSWASVAGTTTASIDQSWHHIALVRDGSTLRFYLDGSQVGTMSTSTSPSSIELGASNIYGCRFGVDDLRVSTSAVYPSGTTFTAPTAAHPTSGGGTTATALVGSATTSYQLTGLTNGTQYSVRVAASNAGLVGAYSTAVNGTPSAAPTDPDFSSVQLLMHMDGSNGSTTFTDDSQNGLSVTAYGNAQISTAQAKFDQSLLLDGSGDYLVVTDSSSVTAAGTGDFTFECWFYNPTGSSTVSNSGTILQGGSGSPILRYEQTNLSFGIVGVGYLLSTSQPSYDTWHHVAVCRDSTSTRLYLNGSLATSGTVSNSLTAITHYGAHTNTALNWDGYIDDVRITIGLARYTGSSYTVPTAAFPDA